MATLVLLVGAALYPTTALAAPTSPAYVAPRAPRALRPSPRTRSPFLPFGSPRHRGRIALRTVQDRGEWSHLSAVSETTSFDAPDTEETRARNATGVVGSTPIRSEYPATPTLRECLAFLIPALGIYICSPLMSLIDASFIGRASSLELAALGPASSISDSAPMPLLFLSIGATNLIAKAFATGDRASLARVSRTAVGMGAGGGALLAAALHALAGPISGLYCGGELLAPCAAYVAVRALALPAVVVTTVAQAVCIGTKDTATPMLSVALAGALNLLGDFVLVKALGLGIAGAAWATALSQVAAAGLLVRALRRRGFLAPGDAGRDDGTTAATVRQLLSFVPFLFVMLVKVGWHNACSATAASLGAVPAAAHTALLSVAMVCMVLGDVGSSLSQAFLPAFAATGADGTTTFDLEAARPTVRQLLRCTLAISGSVMCLAAVVGGAFGGRITRDPRVLAEMRRTLPWLVTTLAFHGSAVTLEGLLLSRRRFRGLAANYGVLAAAVAACQVATRRRGLGLAGVWGCYLMFCSSRVVTFSLLGGLWRPGEWLARRGRDKGKSPEGGAMPPTPPAPPV